MNAPHPAEHFTLAEGEKKSTLIAQSSLPAPTPLSSSALLPHPILLSPTSSSPLHRSLSLCVCRVVYEEDTKVADAGTFTIAKEDHTLGNILRMSLLTDRRVLFAGYRMPHPLEPRMALKVKTRPSTEPVTVLLDAVENLQVELRAMEEQFRKALHEQQQRQHSNAMDLL